MATYTLKKDGKWYVKGTDILAPKEFSERKTGFFAKGYVMGDEMNPTRHPVTGEIYTSKAKFRAETKARECVEVGSEKLSHRKREEVAMEKPHETLSRVYDALRDGRPLEVDHSVKGWG